MSETVKLIIEIPKETYEDLKSGKIYSSLCEAPQGLVEGIRNGTPLDSVKAEIKEKYREAEFMNEFIDGCNHTIGEVLEILDSIGKGDKEEHRDE